jgi:hypothetical protein
VIRTATEFKADMKEMATICNISHEKNVYVAVESFFQSILTPFTDHARSMP